MCCHPCAETRAQGAFVTKPDNRISRFLKMLLREMPGQLAAVRAANLAAALALSDAPPSGDNPPPTAPSLLERHRTIADLQVCGCC
jgi:coiled-coil and C2 domain-containing protein 2A